MIAWFRLMVGWRLVLVSSRNPGAMQIDKGLGILEKSDPIDAPLIRTFSETVELTSTLPKTQDQESHEALVRRREQLLQLIHQEDNRRGQAWDKTSQASIGNVVRVLKKQQETIEKNILLTTAGLRQSEERRPCRLQEKTSDDSQRDGQNK